MWSYPVVLERDADGRVLVSFPDFPEAHTYADDDEEALVRARDALATIVDAYIRDRQPIPYPSRGYPSVTLPALTAAKIGLYQAMREAHVTKTELARRLHWHLPQVDRLLDVYHNSRVDQLEAAFTALDKEMYFEMTDREHLDPRWRNTITTGAGVGGRRRHAARGGATGMSQPRYLLGPERSARSRKTNGQSSRRKGDRRKRR